MASKRIETGKIPQIEVAECVGVNPHTKKLELRDLFVRDASDTAELQPTGSLPTFIGDLIHTGMLKLESFYGTEEKA